MADLLTPEEIEALDRYRVPFEGKITAKDTDRMFATLRAYAEVVRFYLEPDFTEPLGMDGRCHFCRALRASQDDRQEPHADNCAWYGVAKPLYDARELMGRLSVTEGESKE